jgi:hypothetical protein
MKKEPNQPVQTTRLSGAVLLTRPLRSTRDRFSKDLSRARQRASDQRSFGKEAHA